MRTDFQKRLGEFIVAVKGCDDYHLILLVESHFRPTGFRIAEYVLFAVLRILRPAKAQRLTLGMNQLKVRYWEEYLASKKVRVGFLRILAACENISEARAAAKRFLDSKDFSFDKEESISLVYTGRKNLYYDSLFLRSSALLAKYRDSKPTH